MNELLLVDRIRCFLSQGLLSSLYALFSLTSSKRLYWSTLATIRLMISKDGVSHGFYESQMFLVVVEPLILQEKQTRIDFHSVWTLTLLTRIVIFNKEIC